MALVSIPPACDLGSSTIWSKGQGFHMLHGLLFLSAPASLANGQGSLMRTVVHEQLGGSRLGTPLPCKVWPLLLGCPLRLQLLSQSIMQGRCLPRCRQDGGGLDSGPVLTWLHLRPSSPCLFPSHLSHGFPVGKSWLGHNQRVYSCILCKEPTGTPTGMIAIMIIRWEVAACECPKRFYLPV